MTRLAAYALLSLICFAYLGALLDEMNDRLAHTESSIELQQ